ncbi:hypothetical protein B566_EDAN018508 [Ephemera danica]|nr:hypothetical protein B566_EDAN018508 [Ephemera danica]
MQDARDELKELRNEVQVLQKQAEKKQRELDAYQKKVADFRENRNAVKEQLLKVEAGAQKQSEMLQRCDELKQKKLKLNDELDTAWKANQPAIDAHKAAEMKLKQDKDNNKRNHEQKSNEFRHLQNRTEKLKEINMAVENYEAHGKAAQLEALKATVQKLESQRDQLAKKEQDLRLQIDGLKEDLASQEIGSLDQENLTREKIALNDQILTIGNEISNIKGRIKVLAQVISDIEAELEDPKLKFAEQSYKKQLIQNAVMNHVTSDLWKYFKALNKAMINFHQERMETVNRIIRELWVSIYKGIVMVKRDTELDMRGRCSAGQKTLASLVIRIALAETFSANCGILALDEPTTNLDHNNIDSLLAQNHRFQNNFQLIVITHDENFINQLTQAGLVNYFYRVSRNEE